MVVLANANANANTLTPQNNQSVASLHSDHPPQYSEQIPSFSAFDSNPTVDQFANMHISDPVDHTGTPMSLRSTPSLQNSLRHPRHANTLPMAAPAHGPLIRSADDRYATDDTSLYLSDSGITWQDNSNNENADADRANSYAYDESAAYGGISNPTVPDNAGPYPPFYPQPQLQQHQPWQGPQPMFAPEQVRPGVPHTGEYNPLYAAASNVLGIGPPPQPIQPPMAPGYPMSNVSYPESDIPSSSSSYQHMPPHPAPPSNPSMQGGEFERRPTIQRSGTTASVTLRTQTTKAVDLSAPPYTKEYIDQYRQRIKADPDPEAHFRYAKYLIDAAKKIGANAQDQRSVKRYRDILIAESLKVIRRLATQGEAYDEAQFFLAKCYGTGTLGLQVDHERAYHLYLQAAKQNHAAASYRVAVCNEIGAGTRREPPRAAAFYRKAAALGDTPAMYKLGMILLHGTLGELKNPREAINWLKRAAEQADEENPHALHELGLLHESTNSQLVVHDPAYARTLFTQAAHLGYTHSQYKLGQCFEYGTLTCPGDPRRSIAWYTKAAEKGYPEAELALSGWYLTGSEGVLKQSDHEAYLWAKRAANKGLSAAEYAVGYYAEVGIGINQDSDSARRWYMRAAGKLESCVS